MEPIPLIQKQEIIDQMNRILSFPAFSNSMILSEFFRFIVLETIEGRSHSLKEYTIGTQVLLKKAGYDPQTDASVRIHAGRLRRALDDYYFTLGKNDPLLISVPKGAYIPTFEPPKAFNQSQQGISQNFIHKPTLAVIPFYCLGENSLQTFADGLCDQICTEFTGFSELSVVSYFSSRKIASEVLENKDMALLLDATYLLTGSIQSGDDKVRIRVQLIQSKSQHQIWACSYEKEKSAMYNFAIQDDIVKHVINQIGGSHGIIYREAAKATPIKQSVDIKVYDAVFWYYYLVNDLNEITFKKGLEVMKNTVQLDPQYALGWAILGETYIAGSFFGYDCGAADSIEEGVKCGQKAILIDPRCQHAYQTLSLAYLFQHKPKNCFQLYDQWKKLNLNSTGISGGLGFCLICAGDYERGHKLLSESIQVNPYYQWWFNAGLSIYHFHNSEFEEAIYWANKIQKQSVIWELILKITSYSELNNYSDASFCLEELRKEIPSISEDIKPILGSFLQSEILVDRFLNAFKKAEI